MSKRVRIWMVVGAASLALGLGLAWALLAPDGSSQSASPVDIASIQESVQAASPSTSSGQAQAQPPPGGATERGRVQEGVEYIIRDASGRIKGQKKVGGQ